MPDHLLPLDSPTAVSDPVGVAAPPALEVRGVTKRFGDVLANEDVDFRIERGRVHALLGENGAGKSTLVNIIFGLYQADTGEVRKKKKNERKKKKKKDLEKNERKKKKKKKKNERK